MTPARRRRVADLARENAVEYRRQLMAYAVSVAKDADVAEEVVQWAFLDILRSTVEIVDGEAIYFMCSMVSHRFLRLRGRKTKQALQRHGHSGLDDVPGEIQKLSTAPNQQHAAELAEVMREMGRLIPEQRLALTLAGLGNDNTTIAKEMGITRGAAEKLMKAGRETLCRATHRDPKAAGRPPKSGFRGVRRNANKWVAEHNTTKHGRLYLGSFDTAEEAALAFDMAALARVGDKAILNFPDLKDELRRQIAA